MILAFATGTDLKTGRIPNRLIVIGYAIGFTIRAYLQGVSGLVEGIFLAMIPIALLAPVFIIRGIGAGDLKILSVAAVFMDRSKVTGLIAISFLIGAVISAVKIIREGQILVRISNIRAYLFECVASHRVMPYRSASGSASHIRFCGCIFTGFVIQMLTEVNGY